MQKVLFIIIILLALALEWSLARMLYPVGFSPPIVMAVLIFWWWQKPFFIRLVAALAVGFLLDSMSLFHFGTYLIVIGASAILGSIIESSFSHPHEFLPRTISTALPLFFIIFFISPVSGLIGWFQGATFYFTATEMTLITYGALFWSIVLSLVAVTLNKFLASHH